MSNELTVLPAKPRDLIALDDKRWLAVQKMATAVSGVQGFKYFGKKHEALLVAMKAHDMGLTFTEALENVYVVNGRTAIMGQIIVKKIFESGGDLEYVETSNEKSVIKAKRKGHEKYTEWEFTAEDAKVAELIDQTTWRKYRRDLLHWRNIARIGRFMFADIIGSSVHTPEELGIDEERDVSNLTPPEDKTSPLTGVFSTDEKEVDQPAPQQQEQAQPSSTETSGQPAEANSGSVPDFDSPINF